MTDNIFPIPLSFHIYNRPGTTLRVFEQIKNLKPRTLFITADGPIKSVGRDNDKCQEVRLIVDEIDWECEVFKNYSDFNKGSYKSTSEGISWVFQHVDRAIILEDDCIPHPSFFKFCHDLLDYYENDERIALISGNNFLFGKCQQRYSYYFSRYTHMWGWATWKRTWEQVDFKMKNWPEFRDRNGLEVIFRKKYEIMYWTQIMQNMYIGLGYHWDYLLLLSMFMNNQLAIRPGINLICNTGYGKGATHFQNKHKIHDVKASKICFPLIHPPFICKDIIADEHVDKYEFSGGYKQYIFNMIIKLVPQIGINCLKKVISQCRRFWQSVL